MVVVSSVYCFASNCSDYHCTHIQRTVNKYSEPHVSSSCMVRATETEPMRIQHIPIMTKVWNIQVFQNRQ